MRQIGFWILGPVTSFLVLLNIQSDRVTYPEHWDLTWILLRLGIIPVSALACLFIRGKRFGGVWGDIAGYMVAVYVALIHAYMISETGFSDSKYIHATIQILMGAAIIPLTQTGFLASVFSVVGIYVATIWFSGVSLIGYFGYGYGILLHTYPAMSILLYYVIRYARHNGYRAQLLLEDELLTRESEIQRLVAERVAIKQNEALFAQARQVAHDIRSPLSALQMIGNHVIGMPEESRIVLRDATSRIKKIANDLLERRPASRSSSTAENSTQLASALLDGIVSEKHVQYSDRAGVQLTLSLDDSSFGGFIQVEPTEFKRVLSNLIDNSVEALSESGRIEVKCSGTEEKLIIVVEDDGKGIAADVLPRLMQSGATFGKAKGSGLGLYHARHSILSWGGQISIDSKPGSGTTVTIELPLQRPPDWFVPWIAIYPKSTIVIIDDDPTIHRLWSRRLKSFVETLSLQVLHFQEADQMRSWVRTHPEAELYLVDFELIGQKTDGLSLIEELGIQDNSILVTSRYEESSLQTRCKELSVSLLPKVLAATVPFQTMGTKVKSRRNH